MVTWQFDWINFLSNAGMAHLNIIESTLWISINILYVMCLRYNYGFELNNTKLKKK